MPDEDSLATVARRTPWNKGKLIGAKPPLRPNQVWSIRTRLLIERRARDLALFNLAIDSKLRGCDVVALRVEDVAPNGYAVDRATVRQKKTGRPVRFELTDQTRQAIDDSLGGSRVIFGRSAECLHILRQRRNSRHASTAGSGQEATSMVAGKRESNMVASAALQRTAAV
jgi:integrase